MPPQTPKRLLVFYRRYSLFSVL